MEKHNFGKKIISQLLVMCFIATGCMPADVPSTNKNFNPVNGGGSCNGLANCADSGGSTGGAEVVLPPKVEIRHLIEPNLSTDMTYSPGTGYAGGGSYVRKLTLPKNFQGRLYVAGINIGTLADRHVKVRFKFGLNREPVIIPGTVSIAPGITPNTGIHVLVLDLRSEPFRNVRLPYDLFDYNTYDFNNGSVPTQDNRNTGLYCRGLKVQDDPTFIGVGACDGAENNPNQPGEDCMYAYAKVLDQGLIQVSNGQNVPLMPSIAQVKSVAGMNYLMDAMMQALRKPLTDTMPLSAANTMGNYQFSKAANPVHLSDAIDVNFSGGNAWDPVMINGMNYYYRGPYRLVNSAEWEYKFTQLDGKNGLFKTDSWVNGPGGNKIYYNSLLFPLATKMDLQANVAHLSSDAVYGSRTENSLAIAGMSKWMDGANARASSRNSDLEHIGSCNVSASIEIIAKDNNNTEYVIALANDVKLQLVRPTQYRTDTGDEVLFSNFKTCTSNSSCGSNECCFNNRCWDQALVSQCVDPSMVQGNRIIGEACNTDLECSSLCCNRTSGQCSPHNALLNPAVLCSKPIGDFCISQEWCQKSAVTRCVIIKTGTNPLGETTCRQQCYVTMEFGDCKNSICTPPEQGVIPTFNPNDPAACDEAVPAPNFN